MSYVKNGTPIGGTALPTASAAGQVPLSAGAGTTYAATTAGDVVDAAIASVVGAVAGQAIVGDGLGGISTTSADVSAVLAAANAAAARTALGVAASAAGIEAARPAAGTSGRTYVTTDTSAIYADNGSAWVVASNGGGPDAVGLAGLSTTVRLRGTNGPAGGPGTTLVASFYLASLPGAAQQFFWNCLDASHGWALGMSGPGITNNAIDLVLNNSGTLFDVQLGGALAVGKHTVAVAVAADGLSLAYSIDGAAASTVAIAAGSYVAPLAANNHTVGCFFNDSAGASSFEVFGLVSISAAASAAQLAALSGDYATLRIATPAGLTEDFGLRPALIPGHATAPGSSIVGTGSTRRTIATGGTPRVSLR